MFSVKGQIANILTSVGPVVSVTTTHLCHFRASEQMSWLYFNINYYYFCSKGIQFANLSAIVKHNYIHAH